MEEKPLTSLKGVGPAVAKLFVAIGVHTIYDLLHYFPRTHHDFSVISPIAHMKPGMVTIQAVVKQATGRYVRRGMHITEAVLSDASGSARAVWFNQPYRAAAIKADAEYFVTGKLELRNQRFAINNPSMELVSDMPVHTARIVPVYRETKGIRSAQIRKVMKEAVKHLDQIAEVLPEWLRETYDLRTYGEALRELHFPSSPDALAAARRTLGFIEVFELMLASQINKQAIAAEIAPVIALDETFAKGFVGSLPFKLTDAQRKAAWQVLQDMSKDRPMNRLLEGDVGSGKTVVAALAAAMTMQHGLQAAVLAPTELLARQHAEGIAELLKPFGLDNQVSLLVGSLKSSQKTLAHQAIKQGKVRLLIGTHALLQDKVELAELGLIIVDEQHRFGVEQRTILLKNSAKMPHVLSMTATPIPRSLALTLYGELDISLLDALPPGRKPIKTTLVSPNSREKMETLLEQQLEAGHQAYVVCPVINEETKIQTASAEATFKRLSTTTFKHRIVALLHGKQKAEEKQSVMERFVKGDIDILVSTTVIEVGVNVPNATVMVIEGAERFGLAQMHQLRGRVGRSTAQAYCFIVQGDSKPPTRRLRAIEQSTDGFRLAELDLEIRGPGAIYGTMQHGALDLTFANLSDHKLLSEAKSAVTAFLGRKEDLSAYTELGRRVRIAQAVVTLN